MFTKLALDTALALTCSFSNSTVLGEWTSGAIQVERSNHTFESCDGMDLRLACAPNNQLRIEWRYRCNNWMDWNFGGAKFLPISGEKILGQDGYLKEKEFFWDSLIPRSGGTKFEIKETGSGGARFTVGEDPENFYPEYIFRGEFRRAKNLDWANKQLFPLERIHGKWTGNIRIVRKDYVTGAVKKETVCPFGTLDLDFTRHRLFQTHIYKTEPCDGEDLNYYIGPLYFKNESVFATDFDGKTVLAGTATSDGFTSENKVSGYKIKFESAQWSEGVLSYTATERGVDMTVRPVEYYHKDFVLELRRPE